MPRNRRKTDVELADEEDWILTYADAITLLMAFFVMLVSFSKVDLKRFEEVQAGIQEEIGGQVNDDKPIFSLQSKIQAIVDTEALAPPGAVQVGFDDEGVVIDFLSGSFFNPGSVQIADWAKLVLKKISYDLSEPPYDIYFVDVEGHTDDVPISTTRFPSNWELSAHRAASVVRYLIEIGVEANRLEASGLADTQPKAPNLDLLGEPIPENREKNRRVSVRLHP